MILDFGVQFIWILHSKHIYLYLEGKLIKIYLVLLDEGGSWQWSQSCQGWVPLGRVPAGGCHAFPRGMAPKNPKWMPFNRSQHCSRFLWKHQASTWMPFMAHNFGTECPEHGAFNKEQILNIEALLLKRQFHQNGCVCSYEEEIPKIEAFALEASSPQTGCLLFREVRTFALCKSFFLKHGAPKQMPFMKNFYVCKPFCMEKCHCPQSVPMSTEIKIFCVIYVFLIVGPFTWSIEKNSRAKTGCTLEVSDGTSLSFEAQPFKQWFDHNSVFTPCATRQYGMLFLVSCLPHPFSPSSNSYYNLFTLHFLYLSFSEFHRHNPAFLTPKQVPRSDSSLLIVPQYRPGQRNQPGTHAASGKNSAPKGRHPRVRWNTWNPT